MRIAVFILALAVRIAAIELSGAERMTFGDARDYVDHAASLCSRGEYPERGNLPFFRAPGIPFFIAGVTLCEPGRMRAIKYGLALCDAVTVVLIMMLAPAPLIAGLLAALHPLFIAGVTDVRSEPLFMLLLTASIVLLVRKQYAWSGVAVALAALTRPTALLCIPLFALVARRRAHVFLLAAALTLAPWTARNFIRYGEPIVVNDAGGFNLWRGTHRELAVAAQTKNRAEFAERSLVFERDTVAAAARIVDARAKTPAARSREWRRMAIEEFRANPWFAIRTAAKRAAIYWRPWLDPIEYGAMTVALSAVVIGGLYLLGAIGLARHPDRTLVLGVLAFFAIVWLAHVPFWTTVRFRTPFTDPLLIGFASAPIAAVLPRVKRFLPLAAIVLPIMAVALVATRLGDFPAARSVIAAMQSAAGEWWAVPLFVALYALFTIFLLPVGLLSAAAALTWGWKLGATIELLTLTVSSVIPYLLARRGLAGFVQRRIGREDLPALDAPFNLLILRIVPIVPFVALNYIAGATRIRLRDYLAMTLLGSIPSAFLFAYFVDTMAGSAMGVVTQAKIVGVCALVAAVAIILRFAARRVARRTSA